MKSTLLFSILVAMISLTGCASHGGSLPVTPTSSPVPTQTATPVPVTSSTSIPMTPTSSPWGAIPRLPAPSSGGFLLSPDGSSLIEWTSDYGRTIELFSVQGQHEGHYDSPNGIALSADWLLDSSGVFIWNQPPSMDAKLGPIVLMDPGGQVHSIGMDGINPERSPDGKWIAATLWGEPSGPDGVELISTSGGTVRKMVLEEGGRFLGWDGSYLIYFAPGGIYSMPQGGGAPLLLIPFSPDDYIDLASNPVYSPDGQVTIVNNRNKEYALDLVHPRLNADANLPAITIDMAYHHSWTRPHETVGFASPNGEGEAVLVDMATGSIDRHTGIVINNALPWAVSWPWLAWSATGTFHLQFTNLQDGNSLDLGKDAADFWNVFSTGTAGGFFVYDMKGDAYVITPSRLHDLEFDTYGASTPVPVTSSTSIPVTPTSTPWATYSHLQPPGAADVSESDTCGPWVGTDGSVGAALSQKYGELRNCFLFDNSWIILTLGLQGQSGVVAEYRCAATDAACLDGQTDHPLTGWSIYVPPCKGGETLGPESDPSTGKFMILGGCEQWFDVYTGTFTVRYYSTP